MSPTTTCTVINNVISLFDPFDVYYTPDSAELLSFSIEGMTMPASLQPPGAVIFTSLIKNGSAYYSVDSSSKSGLFVSTVGSMTDATATPTSKFAYITTTYTFSFIPRHDVLQNGIVKVTLPSQVSIPNSATSIAS
jgi:hypothetical protein